MIPFVLYLRSDAGSNFTSNEVKSKCNSNNITLTLAGPKHQEQNVFVERAHGNASIMARSMLVRDRIPYCSFYWLMIMFGNK